MTDDSPSTLPELLESIDYDQRQAARSVAIYAAMIGLGVVIGAIFTALLVAHSMDPIMPAEPGVTDPIIDQQLGETPPEPEPEAYRLELAALLAARDLVALTGLGAFLAGAIALGALELEWF